MATVALRELKYNCAAARSLGHSHFFATVKFCANFWLLELRNRERECIYDSLAEMVTNRTKPNKQTNKQTNKQDKKKNYKQGTSSEAPGEDSKETLFTEF